MTGSGKSCVILPTDPRLVRAVPDNTPYHEAWEATFGQLFNRHAGVRAAVAEPDPYWLKRIQTGNSFYNHRALITFCAHRLWKRMAAKLRTHGVKLSSQIKSCTPAGLINHSRTAWTFRCKNAYCPSDRYRYIVEWSKGLYDYIDGMLITSLELAVVPVHGHTAITLDQRKLLIVAIHRCTNHRNWTYGQAIVIPAAIHGRLGLKATIVALVDAPIAKKPHVLLGVQTGQWSQAIAATKASVTQVIADAAEYSPELMYSNQFETVAAMITVTKRLKSYAYGYAHRSKPYDTDRLNDSSRFTSPAENMAEQTGHPQRLIPQS